MVSSIKSKDRPLWAKEDWNREDYKGRNCVTQLWNGSNQVDIKNMQDLSYEYFKREYLSKKKPVVIRGCTHTWKSEEFWNHRKLLQLLGNKLYKVGEDDDGQKLRMTMNSFIKYMIHNTDDSPLYLFENTNVATEELRPILDNYQVPPYFTEDVFALLDDKDRPPFRW